MTGRHPMIAAVVLLSTLWLTAASARAESGWVSGQWRFWNANGHYCPSTGRSCWGAVYTQSQFNTQQALRNIQVFIQHDSAGIIGSGFTDTLGNYNIQWSVTGTLANKNLTRVWVRPWQRDGRFIVNNAQGQFPSNQTPYFTITAGTTQASPQNRGTFCVGACTSASPDPFYNAYWAAELSWRVRLATSGWFNSFMTGTEIRGFANVMSGFIGTCNSSCAGNNRVQLDAAAGFVPQPRVMHEYGHIAVEVSQDWTFASACYTKGGNAGWQYNSDEHACAAWEEAMATFLADSTLYEHFAAAPHSCAPNAGPCPTNSFNIETSSGSACATGEAGWPLSHMRALWDTFDSVQDSETVNESPNWWRIYRTYTEYPSGTGTDANDEHWNSGYTALSPADGRGFRSYVNNYSDNLNISAARTRNCSPL